MKLKVSVFFILFYFFGLLVPIKTNIVIVKRANERDEELVSITIK